VVDLGELEPRGGKELLGVDPGSQEKAPDLEQQKTTRGGELTGKHCLGQRTGDSPLGGIRGLKPCDFDIQVQ
jgi:hypothetical protein